MALKSYLESNKIRNINDLNTAVEVPESLIRKNTYKDYKHCSELDLVSKKYGFKKAELNFKEIYFVDMPMDLGDSNKIELIDCVFGEEVIITGNNLSNITISNCIFVKGLKIKSIGKQNPVELQLSNSNIAYLNLCSSNIKLNMFYNNIYSLNFEDMKMHSNNFTGNSIEYFKAEKTIEFSDVPFDFKQINLRKTRKIKKKTNIPKKFVFKPIKEFNPRENNHKEIMDSTIEFLLKYSNIKSNKPATTDLTYHWLLNKQHRWFSSIFFRFTGGFRRPWFWLFYAFVTIIGFGMIYNLPYFEFTTNGITAPLNDFMKASYFSGITFTTIGYGDVLPFSYAKALAILEGLFGISIMSAFLVSLVKKYVEH